MKITSISSPRYANQSGTLIDVDVEFDALLGVHGFTAKQNDIDAKSKLIYDQAIAGTFGPVAAYVAPVKTQAQINAEADAAIKKLSIDALPDVIEIVAKLASGADKTKINAIDAAIKTAKAKKA